MRAVISVVAFTILTSWAPAPALKAQAATSCDRACLGDVVTRYLNSLIAHDPKQAPLADTARFTEDAAVKPIGDGLWKTATKLRPYRTDFLDVRQGAAAVHAVIEENGAPVLFAARLKVVNRKITEIESMVARNAQEAMLFAPDNLKEKSVAMTTMPDKAQLTARDQMVQIALKYPEGLRIGSFAKAGVPFGPGVYRIENGVRMGGPGCTLQPPSCEDMLNQRIPTLAGIKSRVIAVDEEAGLVMLWLDFGPGSLMGANAAGRSLVTFEGFKIYGGQIHAVEAVFKGMPLNSPTGWDEPQR